MIANVHIETEHREGKTRLKDLYYSPPFRIADISGRRPKNLRLMQMSSSPGILEGDAFHLGIKLKRNSVASLETQAYQRLYKMKEGATQQTLIDLEENTFFEYLPHPTVPHAGSSFRNTTSISMTASSRLIIGEIFTCGRILCNEQFMFGKIYTETCIRIDKDLVLKEKMVLVPNEAITRIGMMERFTHQGSMFIIDRSINADEMVREIRDEFNAEHLGVSKINNDGIAIRIMGNKAEPLFNSFQQIATQYKISIGHGC